MKKILFIVCVVIILISCTSRGKKKRIYTNFPVNTTSYKINPTPFIPSLPNELDENSGLIYWDGLLWTINDSGGENKVYAFDFTGKIQKEIEVVGAENEDWEEIAQDEKNIYIGDFGNNFGMRKNLKIYIIKKKNIGKDSIQKVVSKTIRYHYSDQKDFGFQRQTTPYDCEAMVEFDNVLYIFTKNWKAKTTTVYRLPNKDGKYSLNPVDSFNVQGLVTAADISKDKTKLAILGYENYIPFLWIFNDIKADSLFKASQTFMEMDSLEYAQTEGICFLGNDTLLISCEETNSFNQQVFLIDLKTVENGTHSGK